MVKFEGFKPLNTLIHPQYSVIPSYNPHSPYFLVPHDPAAQALGGSECPTCRIQEADLAKTPGWSQVDRLRRGDALFDAEYVCVNAHMYSRYVCVCMHMHMHIYAHTHIFMVIKSWLGHGLWWLAMGHILQACDCCVVSALSPKNTVPTKSTNLNAW